MFRYQDKAHYKEIISKFNKLDNGINVRFARILDDWRREVK